VAIAGAGDLGELDRAEQSARLVEVARSLGPLIDSCTERIERDRTLPPELVTAMSDAGVFRAFLPRELGGIEAHPVPWMDMVEELSYHNGSVGWLAMIQAGSTNLEPEVMREILAKGPWILTSNIGRSGGKAYKVDGGYRITGRWPFASGSPHATWLSGRSVLYDENDEMVIHPVDGLPWGISAYWPASDATLHDTWDGIGLRGTGSGDFSVEDLFVPSEHVNEMGIHHKAYDGPLYRLQFNIFAHAPHALGIARRAIDEFVKLASYKATWGSARQRLLGRQQMHTVAVGHADALVRAARLFAWDTAAQCFENARHNEHVDYELRARMTQSLTLAARHAKEAVELVYEQASTSVVFSGHPLDICMRDIITAAQHIVVLETSYDTVGQYLITRDWPDGPQIDTEHSSIGPPHPHHLGHMPHIE
jgi:alkylation response protein AidB-like acyl-CoA dehydrogenase